MIIRFLLLLLTGIMALSSVSAVSHYGIVQEQAPTDDKNTDDTDDADNQPDDPDDSKKQVPNEIDHEASADDELAGGDTADEASDDSTADVGEVEQAPAVPTAEILILWASPPKDEYEVEAAKLYDIRYIDRCSNRKYCEETRKIVTDDLAGLLLEYIARSLTKRGHDTPTRADAPNAVDYTVFQGQKIELLSGKPGANDAELWGQVTRLVPLAQADRLIGKFQVFSKPESNTIAYMDREEASGRFTMGINDPVHLATDAQEQKLTIAHELMHMIAVSEATPLGSGSTQVQPCDGIVETGEGCYKRGSIYADFTRRFWPKADRDAAAKGVDLGTRAKDHFVTAYASTNAHEDIAESFSIWLINDGKGTTMADAKLRFFNAYPNLVALKQHIRQTLIGGILKERRRVAPRNTTPRT